MIGVGRRGCTALLPVAVRDLAGRDFLERDRQVVLRRRVDHRRRELLEGPLAQIVVVRVDLPCALGGDDHARIRGVDMLKQAVYAGRNHTLSLAVVLALALGPPAHAADVLRVPLGASIDELVAGPDGGAWVGVNPEIVDRPPVVTRVGPDGSQKTVTAGRYRVFSGTLGADGNAWFNTGNEVLRVDAAGGASTVPADLITEQLAAGPDGTLWAVDDDELIRFPPAGAPTRTPLRVPGCAQLHTGALTRAPDGAMWFMDVLCGLIRLAPDGRTTVVKLQDRATDLAADAAGGVWFASDFDWRAGHVDVNGK